MESVSVATLKQQIRVALDENNVSTELTGLQDTDTLTLDELIESKIEDAADAVVRSAPIDMLSDIGNSLDDSICSINVNPPYELSVNLPSDFIRLIRFKINHWKYAVYEVATPTQETLSKLYSPYGVYGTVDRPVVLISPFISQSQVQDENTGGNGNEAQTEVVTQNSTTPVCSLKLEAFSTIPDSQVYLVGCQYAAKPKINSGNISLGDRLKRPTVYYAAYLVASVFGEEKAAEKLLAVCKEMLNLE